MPMYTIEPIMPIDANTTARTDTASAHVPNLLRTTYLVSDLPAAIVLLDEAAVNGQTVPQGKAQWRQAEVLER